MTKATRCVIWFSIIGVCAVVLSGVCIEIKTAGWIRDVMLLIAVGALGLGILFATCGSN